MHDAEQEQDVNGRRYVWRWGIAHSATVSGSSIDEFASDELLENKFHHVLSRCSVCPNLYGSS